ncbi:uncharacterized protein LOC129792563 isoform X4 [Lutzomyia longipalpis]|uniref:uncharacterized protein LOC129792563 isoform X4 n=1 Tax=Lutzomyia longipalpis TaxID=7200 RepID=UPI00248460B4|nr:uncharacterized protein LOC129792563 isoform X4 [Lutzomyia longipalpis]
MYVIFPADELLCMTYGAAVPRFKPRPTLDNLREPLVLSPTRPPPPSPVALDDPLDQPTDPTDPTADLSVDPYADEPVVDDPFYGRDPSEFFETAVHYPVLPPPAVKPKKHRPRLHINLGRLGRHAATDHIEPTRLREDLNIHVSNPTFTRENLSKRNYDAFFESGEPVYSLEKRVPPSHETEPPSPSIPEEPQRHSLGLFHHRPRVPPRARSADPEGALEASQKESAKTNRSLFGWRGTRSCSQGPPAMAASAGILRDACHPSLNEALKSHNSVTFKLVKTVSDFTETLAQVYEQHAEALQVLVSNYRKKNSELRKERPACHSTLFHAWETFLQEIEADSQSSSDVASALSRQVARPLLERSFHRKVQSRKIFTHRESFDTIIAKTEEKLSKCRMDYKQSFIAHRSNPTQHSLTLYIDSHNAYVQQLHATNAMLESYHCETLPQLLQELEDIYNDLCATISEAVLQGAEAISTKAIEQAKRYDGLSNQCKSVSGPQDLGHFTRVLPLPPNPSKVPKKAFAPPQPVPGPETEDAQEYDENLPPPLRNELVVERGASIQVRPSFEALKREAADLEMQIRQLQDSVDALVRNQLRGLESQLYNKANELQEDISMKKFDLRAKQIHLAAVRAQKDLFLARVEPGSPRGERKLSVSSSSSMKTKWLKAFRSLKPASGSAANEKTNQMYHAVSTVLTMRKNGAAATAERVRVGDGDTHNLQEYTYKKITPCDVCSQVLRGHTRQGLRCRICKMNAHADCASQLPKCQVKQKLLRRQKSTSEIENRVEVEEEKPNEIDQIYQVLKQAGEISNKSNEKTGNGAPTAPPDINVIKAPECPERSALRRAPPKVPPSQVVPPQQRQGLSAPLADVSSSDCRIPVPMVANSNTPPGAFDTGTRRRLFAGFRPLSGFGRGRLRSAQHRSISLPETAPHSPRRQKLNLRMKSLSLDSPESTELHGQMRRRGHPGPSSSNYHGGSGGALEHSTPPSNNSRLHSPSSPSQQQRKLLYANRGLRTGSVDLPDDVEKSQSSASTSPCPSPVRQNQKPHRLLPTNLYVVLYNFKARHQDELDLKAGYKVTVIDTSDPDWWKGKCLGRVGYFPSKYCTRLAAGEKPLQVTHNLQVSDGERGDSGMTLLRDQIVIQVGEEVGGMVMVRSAENRQGVCPVKYLQEV